MILTEKQQKCQYYHRGKIDKYEYITGEEILPSGESRIIEQAKSTYSPLDKAFEKQIKTMQDQREKQIKALEKHGMQLMKSSSEKNSLTLLNQKDIFDELINEGMDEIQRLRDQIDFNNLIYYFKDKSVAKYSIG